AISDASKQAALAGAKSAIAALNDQDWRAAA
ncbi:MAG: hypothetical protein V7640_2294, partial [Betaproteobacteria bacterium]